MKLRKTPKHSCPGIQSVVVRMEEVDQNFQVGKQLSSSVCNTAQNTVSSCSQFPDLVLIPHRSTCQGWRGLAAAASRDLEA